MGDKLKHFVDGVSAVKQTVSLLTLATAGIVSATLLFSQVAITSEEVDENTKAIKVLRESLGGIATQQQVIIQRLDTEEERNKEFRSRTDRSLDRILDKLTPRTDHRVRPR